MTSREAAWHIGRLLLAAGLLAWDVRFFLFYAFTLLLQLLHRLERLRAIVRVFNVSTETKLLSVADAVGATGAIDARYARLLASLSPEQRKLLDDDVLRSHGAPLI